jgi:hypothetical protein
MTIAAGFTCFDGLVICADTLETVGDYGKRSQSKIVIKPKPNPTPKIEMPRRKSDPPRPPREPEPDCVVVFAGAGEADFIDKLIDTLWKKIGPAVTHTEKIEAMEDAAIEFYKKYWSIYPIDQRPEVHLLVALRTEEKMELLKVIGPIVNRIESYESIGYGIALSKYLIDRLYQKSMSVNDTAIVANYMLDQVKEHVQYCGGESHIMRIDPKGYTDMILASSIQWGQERFAKLDSSLRPLLIAVGDMMIPEEEFKKQTISFTHKMEKMREELSKFHSALDFWSDYRPGK